MEKWNKIINKYGEYSNLPEEFKNVLIYFCDKNIIRIGFCCFYDESLSWKIVGGFCHETEGINWTEYPDYWMELPKFSKE